MKVKSRQLIYFLLTMLLLFDNVFQRIDILRYWDETIVLLLFLAVVSKRLRYNVSRNTYTLLNLLTLLIAVGTVGTITLYTLQPYKMAIIKDMIAFIKLPAVWILMNHLSVSHYTETTGNELEAMETAARVFIVSAIISALLGWYFKLPFYTGDYRLVNPYQFVFDHPTVLVASTVFSMGIILTSDRKGKSCFLFLGCILLFMSQRAKGYVAILIIVLLVIMKESWIQGILPIGNMKRGGIIYAALFLLLTGGMTYAMLQGKFQSYREAGMSAARVALYVTGINLAIRYFPFGTGFGTFGTYLSGEYYSNIYHRENLDWIAGLRPDAYEYAGDALYAGIIGQFGFLGLLIYLILLARMCLCDLAIAKEITVKGVLLIWIYAVMASVTETYFTNSTAVAMAIILNMILQTIKRESNRTPVWRIAVDT